MERLPLLWESEHALLVVGGRRFVLDTGSPMSFGDGGPVTCDGLPVPLPPGLMGLNAAALSRLLGATIDGLLGNDFIARFDWHFDPLAGSTTASAEPLPVSGREVALRFVQSVPLMQAQVAGKTVALIFDSGAKLSYLERGLTAGFPDAGTEQDFLPMFGAFQTETVRAPIEISGHTFTFRFGKATPPIQMALTMTGSSGIVGSELLKARAIDYAPRRAALWLA